MESSHAFCVFLLCFVHLLGSTCPLICSSFPFPIVSILAYVYPRLFLVACSHLDLLSPKLAAMTAIMIQHKSPLATEDTMLFPGVS